MLLKLEINFFKMFFNQIFLVLNGFNSILFAFMLCL